MFKCFHEANDIDICSTICHGEIFAKQEGHMPLYSNNLECLNLLLPSKAAWRILDLSYCGIGDMGMQLLHHSLTANINLDTLKL